MGRSENDAARGWHQPEREKLFIQSAMASRPAMIPHRNNETSSQPANDLGGVPAVYDSFGKASARWGYVAGSPSSRHTPRRGFAWQMQTFVHARLPSADLLRRPQPVICPVLIFLSGQAGDAWQIRRKHHVYLCRHQAYFGAPDAGFQNAGGEYEPIFT